MKVSGAKIREFRESQGLSVAVLAGKFDPQVTRQAVEAWEKNGVGGFKTLNKIAKALGVSPALLLEFGNGE
jgi:transcriptional regulator with XRE-family HTH domain